MKHHDRPWKCSIQDCAYAEGGFLSRKMRDDHYKDHIVTGSQDIPHAENPDPDEIQPLLFDLVKADKVEVVKSLLYQFEALPKVVRKAIRECAVSFASAAMIDLIEPFREAESGFPDDMLRSCVRAANIDLFKHLLSRSKNHRRCYYSVVVDEVLRSDSEEIFESWVSYIDYDRNTMTIRSKIPWGAYFTRSDVILATAGHPGRENLLITLWEKTGILKSFNRTYLASAIASVASSTCSVKLAKYFVEHGAEVDLNLRRSEAYFTPLHHAARRNSAAAAEMMEYLLLQGADPEVTGGRARFRIRDEKGAKGIAQWLGMSWDELIAKTKEERERTASKEHEKRSLTSST